MHNRLNVIQHQSSAPISF